MPEVFDPGRPGVTRPQMVDWINVNHPHTIVRGNLRTAGVAELVRSLQPDCKFITCESLWLGSVTS